jgi:hypothetical protein
MEYHEKHSGSFVPWVGILFLYDDHVVWKLTIVSNRQIPGNTQTTLCQVPPIGTPASATLVANSTSISEVFKRNHAQFVSMFRRKA